MEDISLMKMNRDECLELSSCNFSKILSSDIDKCIQHIQEDLVCVGHDLLVCASACESKLSISSPDKLDTKNTNLIRMDWKNVGRVAHT